MSSYNATCKKEEKKDSGNQDKKRMFLQSGLCVMAKSESVQKEKAFYTKVQRNSRMIHSSAYFSSIPVNKAPCGAP